MLLAAIVLASLVQGQPSPATPTPINHCDSVIIAQTRSALSDVAAAERVHRKPEHVAISAIYEGTVSIEAHLMRPNMVRVLPVRLELLFDSDAAGLSIRETAGPPATAKPETTLILKNRVLTQVAPEAPFKGLAGDAAATALAEASLWLPCAAARAARTGAASCRPGISIPDQASIWSPITFTAADGHATTLLIDAEHRIGRIESLLPNQRLGDICNWTRFEEWVDSDGDAVPRRLSRFMEQDAASVRYDLTLVSYQSGPSVAKALDIPESQRASFPDWNRPHPAGGMEFVPIAADLWSVEITASDSRVLIIERESDLVVLGAPDGDAVCGSLAAALKDRFPRKPIATVAFSHHHPSPSGGLRALAAAGATILAPRELEDHIRTLLSRPTTLGPPAIPGPEIPRLQLFDGDTAIDAGQNSVQLINIGEHSAHTFSYIVFYFPSLGLLVEDDLGYFPTKGAARVSPRLIGMAEQLAERHIKPTRLIQGWPVQNVLREVEWSSVAQLVEEAQAAPNKP